MELTCTSFSVCRALGLPCRCVTNYSSAHDSDASITIDQHWDTVEDTALESLDKDSVWYVYMSHGYHVLVLGQTTAWLMTMMLVLPSNNIGILLKEQP